MYKNHILDVGAFNGLDGLILAVKNPEFMIHAFEPNPYLLKEIKKNKKKIELFKEIKITNYKINNLAVSDTNGYLNFNITKNPTVSSLNKFSTNIDKSWPGYSEPHCTVIKKIKVKSITLENYCIDNKINAVNYLHIDAQGSDLKVLKGLKKKIQIVKSGVLEASINKKNSLYQKNHTIKEVKFFLNKNNLKILKIVDVAKNIKNEKNVFFQSKNYLNHKKINIKYNLKLFNRIISDRINIIDKIMHHLSKLF